MVDSALMAIASIIGIIAWVVADGSSLARILPFAYSLVSFGFIASWRAEGQDG